MVIACFQEMPAQVSKSKFSQDLTVTQGIRGHFYFTVAPPTNGVIKFTQFEEVFL